jgi:hypothetical protein
MMTVLSQSLSSASSLFFWSLSSLASSSSCSSSELLSSASSSSISSCAVFLARLFSEDASCFVSSYSFGLEAAFYGFATPSLAVLASVSYRLRQSKT